MQHTNIRNSTSTTKRASVVALLLALSSVVLTASYDANASDSLSGRFFDSQIVKKYFSACDGSGNAILAMNKAGLKNPENEKARWGVSFHPSLGMAKSGAIARCASSGCKVIDINCESEFIKKVRRDTRVGASRTDSTQGERFLVGTGTGFVINDEYVITADHVLAECNAVSIRHKHREIEGEIAARDTNNDLGLIRLEKKFKSFAKLRDGKPTILGEMVANYGYPLFGQLSDAAKVTQGNINALAGWQNDSSILQFDSPTQPGNSGGPLLDASANIVGVVSSSLSKEYAIQTDHIAQNVNFAVKSYLVESFLTANGVTYEKEESTEELSLPQIAKEAEAFTVLVGCWQ